MAPTKDRVKRGPGIYITGDVRRFSVSVPRDIHEALTQLAVKGNRSLSREVRQALEEYVARENGKTK